MPIYLLYFCLIFSFTTPLFAETEPELVVNDELASVTALEGLPSSIVNGAVCVISGLRIDHEVDFVLSGPDQLVFERVYSSAPSIGNLGTGWNVNHGSKAECFFMNNYGESDLACFITDPTGSRSFHKKKGERSDLKKESVVELKLEEPKGLTNGAAGEISARTNPRNRRAKWLPKKKQIVCENGAKEVRTFCCTDKDRYYAIANETKPNGLTYHYHPHRDQFLSIKKLEWLHTQTKKRFGFFDVSIKSDKRRDKPYIVQLQTSDQRKIEYQVDKHIYYREVDITVNERLIPDVIPIFYNYLSKVKNSYKPEENYSYKKSYYNETLLLDKKEWPENRYIKTNYYKPVSAVAKGNILYETVGDVSAKRNVYWVDRVKSLYAPVGTTEKAIQTHRFLYDFTYKTNHDNSLKSQKGSTHVFDAYLHRTSYTYDSDNHLQEIAKFAGKGESILYSKEKFHWGKKSNRGNLLTKYLEDHLGNIFYLRRYLYDQEGNILENRLYGSLTGRKGVAIHLNENGIPTNPYECEIKKYGYSKNGYNLVLFEEDSNGVRTQMRYVPGTNLVEARFKIFQGKVFSREFFEYDDSMAVARKIVDDGETRRKGSLVGASCRLVVDYINRQAVPVGLPQHEMHSYLDFTTGQLVRLRRTTFDYNPQGKMVSQHLFDANDQLHSVQTWEYDAHGNITKQVDALGQVTEMSYDANDNLICQTGPSTGHQILNRYDFMNRLIEKREIHCDGKEFSTTFSYDYLGNCVSQVDPYGNETRLDYDAFSRPITTYLPPVANEEGQQVTPILHTKYNIAGYHIEKIDAKGNTTAMEYNIRGQPTKIIYPDGTFERFFYRLDGKLCLKRSREGVRTVYELDAIGRILSETISSTDGSLPKVTRYTYNNSQLTCLTDSEGVETHYTYDGAGRLTFTVKENKRTQTIYDSLGRPAELREWDAADQVLCERVQDAEGNLLSETRYEYDTNGNQTLVQNGDQITTTLYNLHNNPVKIINGAGETTYTQYERFVNEFGQSVLQSITTDALGFQTVDTYDSANQLVCSERLSPYGKLLTRTINRYDLNGNLAEVTHALVEEGEVKESVTTRRRYNVNNQMTEETEAVGTPEQRTTYYFYNALSQLHKKLRPSGQELLHSYDSLGRLQRLYTADGQIDYLYEYDKKDQVTQVMDQVTGQATTRRYNTFSQIASETLAHGLTLDYGYDHLDRICRLDLPDHSAVQYIHGALNLKEARRLQAGKVSYTLAETKHNLCGQVEEVLLPGNNGSAFYQYDTMGRCTKISSNGHEQQVPAGGYDPVGNLTHDLFNGEERFFEYDELNQLTSEKGRRYQFDSLFNRTQTDDLVCRYNALNQLLSQGEEQFSYDKNGNMVERRFKDQVTRYSYDALDRLISIQKGQTEVRYAYDAFNRRISRRVGEKEQLFLYLSLEEVGLWEAGQLKEFKLLVKNQTSSIAAIEIDEKLFVPHHDLSGNIVALTNEKGELVEKYCYSAFGECQVTDSRGKSLPKSLVGNCWQYASKRKEEISGLISFGLRDYDPILARWLCTDPAGQEGGANLYVYVFNSPLLYKDEFGLFRLPVQRGPNPVSNLFDYMVTSPNVHFVNLEDKFGHLTGSEERSNNYNLNSCDLADAQDNDFFYPTSSNSVGCVNGVANNLEDAMNMALHFATLLDHDITFTHAASFGLPLDAVRYTLSRRGFVGEVVKKIHENWDRHFDKNPGKYLFWICHSCGVVDTRNALKAYPPHLRDRIVILALAPGGFIESDLCAAVLHVVSSYDPVPRLDPIGWIRCSHTIEVVKGQGFTDHLVTHNMYKDATINYYQLFKERYCNEK